MSSDTPRGQDGIRFQKPLLGLVEYGGTTSNNVCRVEPYGKPGLGSHSHHSGPPTTRSGAPLLGRRSTALARRQHSDSPMGGCSLQRRR